MTKSFSSYLHFLWAGLVKHGQTGGFIPSQSILTGRMIAPIPADYSGQIIELGAGSGALTLKLAQKCTKARILSCEINPVLAKDNEANVAKAGFQDRVKVSTNAAEKLLAEPHKSGLANTDFILSGIPLGYLGGEKTQALIEFIHGALAPKGLYIQFQHSLLDRKRIKTLFGEIKTVPVLLNMPPAVVYYARKQG